MPYREANPRSLGEDGAGYWHKELEDGKIRINIRGYEDTKKELFYFYSHKKAAELCGEVKYTVYEFGQTIRMVSHTSRKYPSYGYSWVIKCI